MIWDTNSTKIGWNVEGIYPPGEDGSHINGVDFSKDGKLIATSDDFGLMNIYRNPAFQFRKSVMKIEIMCIYIYNIYMYNDR